MDYKETSIDRRKIMESLFPEFLRENRDYRVFIKVSSEEMGLVSDYIELFTDLVNVDDTPEQFLEDLGKMVGYSYIDEVDPEIQREIIKRVFNIHEARGDEDSLLDMAAYSANPGYLGGEVFIPGTYVEGQSAVLVFPRDTLYTWNKSKRSGFDRYPDGIGAQDGVLEIIVGYLDDNVRNRTESVKPAGVRLLFKINVVITNEGKILKIQTPLLYTDVSLFLNTYINTRRRSPFGANSWSGRARSIRWSGRRDLWVAVGTEVELAIKPEAKEGSVLPLYYPNASWTDISKKHLQVPFGIIKGFRGLPRFSNNFKWSGRYARSGTFTNTVFVNTEVPYRHQMNLDNNYMPLMVYEDELLSGFRDPTKNDVISMFEITVKRRQE